MYAIASQFDEQSAAGGLPSHVRARGEIAFSVKCRDGKSVRDQVRESGSLRLRFPREAGEGLHGVLVNTAGGMTGGDGFSIHADVCAQGQLTLTTSAAEKFYRSDGDCAKIVVSLRSGAGAKLAWLPQESIVFDGARVRRTYDIDFLSGSRLLLFDATSFGRTAMGEQLCDLDVRDRWLIRRDGELIFADFTSLVGPAAELLPAMVVTDGAASIATLIYNGEDGEAVCVHWNGLLEEFEPDVTGGAGLVNGLCVARFIAADLSRLRQLLTAAITVPDEMAVPRSWMT